MVYTPLNSPITNIKLVNSPITNNSDLFHEPLSRVTNISCVTIHHLKYASFTSHQELKQLFTSHYSQFTFKNSRFNWNKTGHSPITKIVYIPHDKQLHAYNTLQCVPSIWRLILQLHAYNTLQCVPSTWRLILQLHAYNTLQCVPSIWRLILQLWLWIVLYG